MDGHVTKPIDPDQLFATLQKWIKPGEKRIKDQHPQVSTQHPESDPSIPGEAALPESLPGFDLAAGLQRLMGNKRLYRKLLVDFGTKYTETAGEIRGALDAKDFEQAHSLIHNLKGLAGNLEAKGLQAATVGIEKLVKGQTEKTVSVKELDLKFAELKNALDQALDAVQTLIPPDGKGTIAGGGEKKAAVSPKLARGAVDRIKAAVEMGDIMQIQSIAKELKSTDDAMAPFCDKLIQLAEDFDFDGIQRCVNELDG